MSEIVVAPGSALVAERTLPRHAAPASGWRALASQPAVARALPFAAPLALAGAIALAWTTLTAAPQREVATGLSDSDKAAAATQLDSAAIPYAFDPDTGALTVDADAYHRARMALASAGLPKSAPEGDTMLDNLPMGASRAVEGERLRQAREADLARTIEAIDAVATARVHLAVEPPSAFLRDRAAPAASVMLRLKAGRTLSEGQVQAIGRLVAASVPGLSPDGVAVVDQAGRLLSGNGGIGAEDDRQLRIQGEVEDRLRRALATLLTPIVGAGAFTAEVSADLDFSERQATRETYPADDARVRSEQGRWSSDRGERPGYGVPGTLSNVIPPDAVATTTPPVADPNAPPAADTSAVVATNPQRSSEEFKRQFELGREVSVTRATTPTMRRVSVAVALAQPKGKPRTVAEIAAIEALVKSAVGFDAARGDQVTVTARPFVAAEPAAEPALWEAPWFESAVRNGTALLVVLALLLGVGLPLRKRARRRRAEAEATEAALADAVAAQALSGLAPAGSGGEGAGTTAAPGRPVTLDAIAAAPSYAARADLVRAFVRQDPDHAAAVVRRLLSGNAGPGEAAR